MPTSPAPQGTGLNKSINVSDIVAKFKPKDAKSRAISREINLVPDVKNEMIKTLKLRNFIFFLSIVIAGGSLAAILIFASIAGGQQAIVNAKKDSIEAMAAKINGYGELNNFLTIKDQLSNISSITDNKKLLSRTFNVIAALLPTGADYVKISELTVDLSEDTPVFAFDAQADAGNPPKIDYNVLDSFKKSMQYMRYDYGTYVDKEGAEIPAYCIIENDNDGSTLVDSNRGYYAYWLITGEGCNPSYVEEDEEEDEEEDKTVSSNNNSSANSGTDTGTNSASDNTSNNTTEATTEALDPAIAKLAKDYTIETYNDQTVVRIWRTPQFNIWYQEDPTDDLPSMDLDGTISNVAHFNSQCITYTGYDTKEYVGDSDQSETVVAVENGITWVSRNDSCYLVPDEANKESGSEGGITISDSSNGRDSDNELVLRFSAVIKLAPEVFNFSNHHLIAIGPRNRYNVTDSYVQIQNMFSKRAADCAEGDTACKNNTNKGGN